MPVIICRAFWELAQNCAEGAPLWGIMGSDVFRSLNQGLFCPVLPFFYTGGTNLNAAACNFYLCCYILYCILLDIFAG